MLDTLRKLDGRSHGAAPRCTQPWGENECAHGEDVGLCCWGSDELGTKGRRKGPSAFPRCPSAETPQPPPKEEEEEQDSDGESGSVHPHDVQSASTSF